MFVECTRTDPDTRVDDFTDGFSCCPNVRELGNGNGRREERGELECH
jgi:hypothetical protein